MCPSFPFGIEGGMWDVIVFIPDHCLSVYFTLFLDLSEKKTSSLKRKQNLQILFFEDEKQNQDIKLMEVKTYQSHPSRLTPLIQQ